MVVDVFFSRALRMSGKKYRPRYATAVFCDCENEKNRIGERGFCVRRLGSLGGLGEDL